MEGRVISIRVYVGQVRTGSTSVEEYLSGVYRKYGMVRRVSENREVRAEGREERMVRRAREI